MLFSNSSHLHATFESELKWDADSRLIAAEEQHFDANNLAQLQTDMKT
jgi:hypothetical protein